LVVWVDLSPVGLVDVGTFRVAWPRAVAVEIDKVHIHEGVDDLGKREWVSHTRILPQVEEHISRPLLVGEVGREMQEAAR